MPQLSDLDSVLGPAPSLYAQPEVIVLRLRRHGRRLVLPIIVLIAIAGAAGYFVGSLAAPWMNITAAAAAAVLALLLGVMPILLWLSHHVTVTSRRVIMRHGVFVRHRSEVLFARIREVRSRRGLLQRMCGSGDIDLFVGAESVRLSDVPGVSIVVDALQELVERNYEHSTGLYGNTQAVGFTSPYMTAAGTGAVMPGAAAPGFADPGPVVPGAVPPAQPEGPVSFW